MYRSNETRNILIIYFITTIFHFVACYGEIGNLYFPALPSYDIKNSYQHSPQNSPVFNSKPFTQSQSKPEKLYNLPNFDDIEDLGSGEVNPVPQKQLNLNSPPKSLLNPPQLSIADYNKNRNHQATVNGFSCRGRSQGFYADIASNCVKYHRCVLNKHYTFFCPGKMIFDQSLLVCVQGERALPCHQAINYYSLNGKRFLQEIPPSNEDAGINLQQFSCVGKRAGNYADVKSKCRLFFQCFSDSLLPATIMMCPQYFVFDSIGNRCVLNHSNFICKS